MRTTHYILAALVATIAVYATAVSTRWLVSPLGDARKAWVKSDIPRSALWNGGKVSFEIPEGEWNDITATFWIRNFSTNAAISTEIVWQTIGLTYCPETLNRGMPDELNGLGGWGVGGVNVNGSLVIPMTMEPHWTYTNRVMASPTTSDANRFGAYSINAIVTNEIGLSIGGVEHVLMAGTNSFNSYGGASPFVTITGSGNVQIGISRMYWHEYFDRINGVASEENEMMLAQSSTVTNEMVFVSCRIHLDDAGHWTQDSMTHWDGNDVQGKTVTNSLPANPSCRALSSRGDYKVGLIGLGSDDRLLVDVFDFRVHSWWLSETELSQTRLNGKQEMIRRGTPKNKEW